MKKILLLIIMISFLAPVILPVFKPYVPGTADGIGHRFRLVSFYNSLREGVVRPRWAKEAALGYGAPTFLFNYPLPYYFASFFHALGFGINTSGQLLSVVSITLSFFFMFLLARKISGNFGGLVGAIIYTYAPYHLQMTYLYDSWGEEVAFIFPPLLLYLIIKLIESYQINLSKTQNSKVKTQNENSNLKTLKKFNTSSFCTLHFSLLTFVWFLFILSHNLSALIFSPILLFLTLVISHLRIRDISIVFSSFILSVFLSAYFWFPAISMGHFINYGKFVAVESKTDFFKPIIGQVATAFRVIRAGSTHYLDFTIGLPITVIAIFQFIVLSRKLRRNSFNSPITNYKLPIAIFSILLVSLFLTSPISAPVWKLPGMALVLYPFRFLFLATFAGAILAALLVAKNKFIGLIFIVLALVQGLPYTKPYVEIFNFQESYFFRPQTMTYIPRARKNTLTQEFLPGTTDLTYFKKEEFEYWTRQTDDRADSKEIEGEAGVGIKIEKINSGSEKVTASVTASKATDMFFHRFYFPSWKLYIDGKSVGIMAKNGGRIAARIEQGTHQLELIWAMTDSEKLGYYISVIGIILYIGAIVYIWRYSLLV